MSSAASRAIFGPMRLPFLLLPPACVMLGAATAVHAGHAIDPLDLVLVLVGALGAHISVNALNEYHDFTSGLDFTTERTPFSGGSGALVQHPTMARLALVTGVVSLGLTAAIGLYFVARHGLALLPLGLVGCLIVVSYTRWITAAPLLCLIAPGLGFGPLMVMGTDFVLAGRYSCTAAVASLVPFFLVNDLLLLNQFPDARADECVGRRHIPIAWGLKAAAQVYAVFLLATYVAMIAGVVGGFLPLWALLGLATLPLALVTMRGVWRYAEDLPALVPYMGRNVVLNLATPVLLAVGLLLGR